jgi:hypothetical protein
MTVELVVLGVVLIVMGVVQTWLRHGPGAKALRAQEEAVADRRAEYEAARARLQARKGDADDLETDEDEEADADAGAASAEGRDGACVPTRRRGGKAWTAWTAILGGVGIALGIVLIVLGVLGY